MNSLKRHGLTTVFMVCATLVASTAHAKEPAGEEWGTILLSNVGDESGAAGEATLTNVACTLTYVHNAGDGSTPAYVYTLKSYTGVMTVTCQNLTPRATYWTPAGTFRADRTGKGTIKGKVSFLIETVHDPWSGTTTLLSWFVVDVVRLGPDGSRETVLECDFTPPGM